MKLRQSSYYVFIRRIGVFEHIKNPYQSDSDWAYMRLKEAKATYPWLIRDGPYAFTPLMIDPVRITNNPPSVSWRRTRHTEKIRLNRLTRRRNRQHITDEDYDFRRVRVNRRFFE